MALAVCGWISYQGRFYDSLPYHIQFYEQTQRVPASEFCEVCVLLIGGGSSRAAPIGRFPRAEAAADFEQQKLGGRPRDY
eukprot:scaffold1720_cov238-Pinguiococcus_pyrenoidosus.AAC.6